jgi:hypothetical protein
VSTMIYGDQVLFSPTETPDADRFVAWTDTVDLLSHRVCLLGPFNFAPVAQNPIDRAPRFQQYVPTAQWDQLILICQHRGIIPPCLHP